MKRRVYFSDFDRNVCCSNRFWLLLLTEHTQKIGKQRALNSTFQSNYLPALFLARESKIKSVAAFIPEIPPHFLRRNVCWSVFPGVRLEGAGYQTDHLALKALRFNGAAWRWKHSNNNFKRISLPVSVRRHVASTMKCIRATFQFQFISKSCQERRVPMVTHSRGKYYCFTVCWQCLSFRDGQ